MKRLTLVLAAAFVLLAQSCMDPEPGEISVRCFIDKQPTPCTVKLFNDKNLQIAQESTDTNGLVYLKNLNPGTYNLEFMARDGSAYPAKKTVKLTGGASEVCDIELMQAPADGGAPADGASGG